MDGIESDGSYRAWDGRYYAGPPPAGWYYASDGRWWTPDTGPGPRHAPACPSPVDGMTRQMEAGGRGRILPVSTPGTSPPPPGSPAFKFDRAAPDDRERAWWANKWMLVPVGLIAALVIGAALAQPEADRVESAREEIAAGSGGTAEAEPDATTTVPPGSQSASTARTTTTTGAAETTSSIEQAATTATAVADPPSSSAAGIEVAPTAAAVATTSPPPTTIASTTVAPTAAAPACDPNYSGCVPVASDVDCAGGTGDGPAYVQGPVQVTGTDIYDLDRDGDGVGCE